MGARRRGRGTTTSSTPSTARQQPPGISPRDKALYAQHDAGPKNLKRRLLKETRQLAHSTIRNITRSRAVLACDVVLARESVCPHVPFQTKFENDAKGDDDDDVHYYKSLQCESEGHKHGGDEGRKRCWKFATKGSTCRGRRRAALRRGCRR